MNDLPKRKSNRLQGYDYSRNGAYFITICTHGRSEILSDINKNMYSLRPIGKIVENELRDLANRYDILIDKYVIMPNHVHMIIFIQRAEQSCRPYKHTEWCRLYLPAWYCVRRL